MVIKGTLQKIELSGGFWAIVDTDGNQWRPSKVPLELQKEGLFIEAELKKEKEQISIFMWGTAVQLLHYKIL